MSQTLAWLALTPEPERELPAALAELRGTDVADERQRLTRLLLHGTQRQWLRYLDTVAVLALAAPPQQRDAARLAATVVLDHHRMLIGLPGNAYATTEITRTALGGFLD